MTTATMSPSIKKLLDEILSSFQGEDGVDQRCSSSMMPAHRSDSATPQGPGSQPSKAFVESVRKRAKAC